MDLKLFQRRVVEEVEKYLRAVAGHRAAGNQRFASQAAWEDLRLGRYDPHKNGLGEDLPVITIKVPTGGGKTLLATQVIGRAYATTHKERNGAGLVLWVVPSSQIFRDTLRRLSDRTDIYRIMLEHAVSRRIELWTKQDVHHLTPAKLRECLNILVVQLASTNRETKEDLKFFRDSGGNIVDHFPPEGDFDAHLRLKQAFPNLEMIEDDPGRGRHLCKTSVGNLVKLCRPLVILDEGHKATSPRARKTIEEFNASLVVELSATPKVAKIDGIERRPNIVSRVTGKELLDEEMIKLPVNIHASGNASWQDVLTKARDKREALAAKAAAVAARAGSVKVIRPIVLVQVERTGKDQDRWPTAIHALDVKDYLTGRLGIPESAIAVKTAENDGLEDVNLDDPDCRVTWIITKSALQEGWDCPQAYLLVALNNTGSLTAMTQLVGRILRQPDQRRTQDPDLNESYVYVLRARAGEVVSEVKKVLEGEGYEGEAAGMVVDASKAGQRGERVVHIRREFADLYTRPFAGKVYLPHFCVKQGREVEPLDYFTHLISQVDVSRFPCDRIDWNLAELGQAQDQFTRVSLGDERWRTFETDVDLVETDHQVLAWMVATLPFEHLSHKQLRRIVAAVYERLCAMELPHHLRGRLATVKFVIRQKVADFVQDQVDAQTEAAFARLYDDERLLFYLECRHCAFEVPAEWTQAVTTRLQHTNADPLERSLFDYVDAGGFNEFEKAIALYLDKHPEVLWWYRNLIGPEHFAIQGFRQHKIRPDFIVQGSPHRPQHHVYVIEPKGEHLAGSEDTAYKRRVADYYQKVGRRVSWQQLGKDFKDHVFRFRILDQQGEHGRDWKDDLAMLLAASS